MKKQTKRKDPKEIFPNTRARIVYAFTIDGTDYYEFDDINNVPCERGFYALAYYRELSMSTDRTILKAHVQAVNDILNNPKGIKITEIAKLNYQLEERLDYLFEPEIAYKLCSVVFFDASENPNTFDFKYAGQKADIFRKQKMDDFFLQKPIVRLIPYLASFGEGFGSYLEAVNKMSKRHLESISTTLSDENKKNEYYKYLESLRQHLSASTQSNPFPSMNISSTSSS